MRARRAPPPDDVVARTFAAARLRQRHLGGVRQGRVPPPPSTRGVSRPHVAIFTTPRLPRREIVMVELRLAPHPSYEHAAARDAGAGRFGCFPGGGYDPGLVCGLQHHGLCLDGARLLPIGTSNGVVEYRTLPDTFVKVLAPPSKISETPADTWKVFTRSGLILEYRASEGRIRKADPATPTLPRPARRRAGDGRTAPPSPRTSRTSSSRHTSALATPPDAPFAPAYTTFAALALSFSSSCSRSPSPPAPRRAAARSKRARAASRASWRETAHMARAVTGTRTSWPSSVRR